MTPEMNARAYVLMRTERITYREACSRLAKQRKRKRTSKPKTEPDTALAVRSQYEKDETLAKKTLIKNNLAPREKVLKTQSGKDREGREAGRKAGDSISLDPQLDQSASQANRLAS